MNVLLVTPNAIDHSSGGSIRSGHIHHALSEVGNVRTVVIRWAAEEHRDNEWEARAVREATYNRSDFSFATFLQRRRLRKWIKQLLRDEHFDVIVVCFVSNVLLVPHEAWSRVVVDADDAFKSVPNPGRSTAAQVIRLLVRNALTSYLVKRVAHVWYVNPGDAKRLPTQRKSFLRNVISPPDPHRQKTAVVSFRLLMVGLMTHPPNLHGLRWFIREVLPALVGQYPSLELHVIGRMEPEVGAELAGKHVIVRGFVPELTAEYDSAALVIAPIFYGGGTQIKVIDALAHGRPLVASEFAHSGFSSDLHAGEHLRVARSSEDWIIACLQLLANPAEAEAMAVRGSAAVKAYEPENLIQCVRQTIAALAPGP